MCTMVSFLFVSDTKRLFFAVGYAEGISSTDGDMAPFNIVCLSTLLTVFLKSS